METVLLCQLLLLVFKILGVLADIVRQWKDMRHLKEEKENVCIQENACIPRKSTEGKILLI